ncbi:kinase-like domain-containing protein [Xylaria sp. FL1042]|nr:kinase-like domain-containing protein [Xylaria sp. FL1042]
MLGGTAFGGQPNSSDELIHDHTDEPIGSPGSFDSPDSSGASTPLDTPDEILADPPKRMPSLRSISDPQNPTHPMSASSTPLGVLSNARRPGAGPHSSSGRLPEDITAKMRAFHLSRSGSSPLGPHAASPGSASPSGISPVGPIMGGIPGNMRLPGGLQRPGAPSFPRSAPAVNTGGGGLAGKRRFGLKLGDMNGGPSPASSQSSGLGQQLATQNGNGHVSQLKQFEEYIDTEKGYLTFKGKAIITNKGVDFSDGSVFRISLDEVEKLDELGKGNYGTVYKVRHSKPRVPRFGPGLASSKMPALSRLSSAASDKVDSALDKKSGSNSGMIMAMKEMRLELDETKLTTIVKELVILHECASPYVIDFYGAFFQESAVYMCIEYMDGGSIDKLYSGGIPENILRKITYSTIMGLKELKEKHSIIHRDVKPTNILINTRGQVKICDFGVSGNLVASMAKTNIGCQSYMAPERISGGSFMQSGASDGTYSVQSDIWSLGLTIIECGMGKYPYPPDVSSTIFSQLTAIVDGDPPDLPDTYTQTACTFVHGCLNKSPKLRPTYQALLASEWLKGLSKPETIAEEDEEVQENDASAEAVADAAESVDISHSGTEDAEIAAWVKEILEKKATGKYGEADGKPALHTAQLDAVATSLCSPSLAS